MKIDVILGNIVEFTGDCIVNSAHRSLLGGGGVDGAIHRAAGPDLLKECRTLGGCKTGDAKITKGYNLPAKYVIHAVGPNYNQYSELKSKFLLRRCYKKSLDLAKANNIHTIAFPSISTGIYGYPLDKATRVAIKTVNHWLKHNKYDINITFVCYNQECYDAYKHNLR